MALGHQDGRGEMSEAGGGLGGVTSSLGGPRDAGSFTEEVMWGVALTGQVQWWAGVSRGAVRTLLLELLAGRG